jgi:hypothetical protein
VSGLALRWLLPARPGEALPDGPCELWIIVADAAGLVMGASPISGQLTWMWRGSKFGLAYGVTRIIVENPGEPARALIVAARPDQHHWVVPLWPISLDVPPGSKLRPGDTVTILDGMIALDPADHH